MRDIEDQLWGNSQEVLIGYVGFEDDKPKRMSRSDYPWVKKQTAPPRIYKSESDARKYTGCKDVRAVYYKGFK